MRIATAPRALLKQVALVIAVCVGGLSVYWFAVSGSILQDRRQVDFLAARDPGSFLIPATCLFFHGTEGKDFVRGPRLASGGELCWYTRDGFRTSYPELWLPAENFTVVRQVARMRVGVFQTEHAWVSYYKAVEVSVRVGAIGIMAIVCLCLLAWQARGKAGKPEAEKGWQWTRRS